MPRTSEASIDVASIPPLPSAVLEETVEKETVEGSVAGAAKGGDRYESHAVGTLGVEEGKGGDYQGQDIHAHSIASSAEGAVELGRTDQEGASRRPRHRLRQRRRYYSDSMMYRLPSTHPCCSAFDWTGFRSARSMTILV